MYVLFYSVFTCGHSRPSSVAAAAGSPSRKPDADERTQSSRNAICSGVWNQCSPPGNADRGARRRVAEEVSVAADAWLSYSPYRIRVGTLQLMGCLRA